MAAPAPEPEANRPTLRERQRQRTRGEISQAALDLFEAQGVEGTTVDDIAHRAGVSPRTFFRHFAMKEDAALLIHHDFDGALHSHLGQGENRSPLATLCSVYSQVLANYGRGDGEAARQMLRVRALMLTSPTLRTASLRLDAQRAQELLEHFMPAGDRNAREELRIRMAVETTAAAVRVTLTIWNDLYNRGTPVDAAHLFAEALDSAGIRPTAEQ
ncbi:MULTISPECIES: TetR/AcrR family transcriptional regulator [Actinoalloteichus]|uniref:TetR/AcrR family transcriptional regulator n=1 Tax=Actinoalloteichus TaxID=65496 RepID=UPI000404EC99|nr:TetR/AcrR family transcriptional regulator [Actinoalloteichus caeruleus]